MSRDNHEPLFDFNGAVATIPVAAIGSVVNGPWVRVIGIDNVSVAVATTSTANGTWKAQVATDSRGSDAVDVAGRDILTAFPVGAGSSGTAVIQIPATRYKYIRIVFTPIGGSGNISATFASFVGHPLNISKLDLGAAVWVSTPASSTHVGQPAFEFGELYYHREYNGSTPTAEDDTIDPPVFAPAVDSTNAAITFAAIASGVNTYVKRLGLLEVQAIRGKYAFTSGTGRVRSRLNAQGT